MDNKIQNIVLKSIMGVIIFLGTLFTIWVILGGDPGKMSDGEMEQLAIKEAKAQNLQETMNQVELDDWIKKTGKEIKEEKQKATFSAVSLVIDFTKYIFFLAVFLIVASMGYLFTIDPKKALKSLAGIAGIVGFILVVYLTAGNDVPQEYVANETLKGVADADRVFTPGNWQFASAAVTSTVILTVVAMVGWVGGTVMKVFK